jgi:CDGSH-type Zn-finger protein
MSVRIRLRQNGPYVIDDPDVQVVDWNGVAYPIGRRPVALCRCGASNTKPFCDGTHARVGWQAADPAPLNGAATTPANPDEMP